MVSITPWESPFTGVQSEVESYQRFGEMVIDASLLNIQHVVVKEKGTDLHII